MERTYVSLGSASNSSQEEILPELPSGHRQRVLGSVYTPPEYANLLVEHGIRSSGDVVLDIGVGGGVFTLAAHRRLQQLGASAQQAEKQIHGTEIDLVSYQHFLKTAAEHGRQFPHIRHEDFFEADLPQFDAVIGNPPYVRRTYIDDVDHIRHVVTRDLLLSGTQHLRRSTDLYIYFLLRAATLLKPGGRFSIITADPWLTVGYGEAFKQHLLTNFEIESLISFDRRVFSGADVKPVLLTATRRTHPMGQSAPVFIRVRNGLPVVDLQRRLLADDFDHIDLNVIRVEQHTLDARRTWTTHFKAGSVSERLAEHPYMAPLKDIAYTSIGVQTLAKPFFVLTSEQAREHGIEEEYLLPLAHSSRTHGSPVIEIGQTPEHLIFYCDKAKNDLVGTGALAYIEAGEKTPVPVRGKGKTVIGYQAKERIQHARRRYWYDLKTLMEKRSRAEILLPRLVYSTFRVVWNRAKFIPGELFIEIKPSEKDLKTIDIRVYLAILNSAPTEMALRIQAQLYGGGTFNINPGSVKQVPVLAPAKLGADERQRLVQAYQSFIDDPKHDTAVINDAVFDVLGLNELQRAEILAVLGDLRDKGPAAKVPQRTKPDQDHQAQL
jgi:methylase of polypeptide subunit release factors